MSTAKGIGGVGKLRAGGGKGSPVKEGGSIPHYR